MMDDILQVVRCSNFFMDTLARHEKIIMLGAFAMAVREGGFLQDCYKVLVEGTVRGAVSHVVQAFRAAGRQNPTKDEDRELIFLFSQQFRAYKTKDPIQKQQKGPTIYPAQQIREATSDRARYCDVLTNYRGSILHLSSLQILDHSKGGQMTAKAIMFAKYQILQRRASHPSAIC